MAAAIQMLAAPGSAAGLGSALAAGPVIGAGPKGSELLAKAWPLLPERIKAILSKTLINWRVGAPKELGPEIERHFPLLAGGSTISPGEIKSVPGNTGFIPVTGGSGSAAHELIHAAQISAGFRPRASNSTFWLESQWDPAIRGNYSLNPFYRKEAARFGIKPSEYVLQMESVPKLTNQMTNLGGAGDIYPRRISPQARRELLTLLELLGRGGTLSPQTQRFRAARAGQEW